MQLQTYQPNLPALLTLVPKEVQPEARPQRKPFIEANTQHVFLEHLEQDCIIPVFSKDNERTISHQEFVYAAVQAIESVFGYNQSLPPEIRVSHTIKGRTPDAIHKNAKDLLDTEKTVYYERLGFAIEIPRFVRTIDGNELTLTVGGVRALNSENLFNRKMMEHFKFFIGFKNLVCCNMCVSSDGFVEDIRVGTMNDLSQKMSDAIRRYSAETHLQQMQLLTQNQITEHQFAQILGKCRLYQYLPRSEKRYIPDLSFNDTQVNAVAREYFGDENFSRGSDGTINLWKMYNLFTGANKSSYIDQFLNRSVNAFELVSGINDAVENKASPYRWFLE